MLNCLHCPIALSLNYFWRFSPLKLDEKFEGKPFTCLSRSLEGEDRLRQHSYSVQFLSSIVSRRIHIFSSAVASAACFRTLLLC